MWLPTCYRIYGNIKNLTDGRVQVAKLVNFSLDVEVSRALATRQRLLY